MNRFLQRGQLQTIESNKDRSVIEDMDTLVNEVDSDELLDMVQQEGTSNDVSQAMDMVEDQFFHKNYDDIMEDELEYESEEDHGYDYDYDDYDSFDEYDD